MTKPVIVTRAGKGSALTWTEGDANFTNLQDATFTLVAGTGGTSVVSDLNGSVTLVAGTNVTLSGDNTAKTVTINATGGGGGLTAVEDDTSPSLGGNLDVGTFVIQSSTNGIRLEPFSGDTIDLVGDVIVGEQNTDTTITTDGTSDLTLSTNGGANSGTIVIADGVNGNITVTPNGTGRLICTNIIQAPTVSVATNTYTSGAMFALSQAHTTADANNFSTNRARGTLTSPTTVNTNDELFEFSVNGHDGTGYVEGLVITTSVSGTVSTGVMPTLTEIKAQTGGSLETYIAIDTENAKTVLNGINYYESELYDLGTTGGTIAPDVANGNVQKITLNSALTLNAFTNPVAGQSLTLIIYGGTAYTSITSTMKFAGGTKTLTATAGCVDILTVYYDGTNYWASLGKDFK
jgi:hypothetical protein